jgi:hypothetical protein
MIEELSKSISSISSDIQSLQLQSTGMDKALSKLANNQATLLSMSAVKPHASPMVGTNSIVVCKILPTTFEETYNELLNYFDLLEPLLVQFEFMKEGEKESIMVVEEKEVEEVKMLIDNIKEPLLDLDKCSLNELINILLSFAPSFNIHQTGFGSYIANHVIKIKIKHYNNEAMIPPKLGDVWVPKILIVVGKESHHAISDLGSRVNIISK